MVSRAKTKTKTKTKTKAKSSGNDKGSVISVCLGTGGIAAGGDKVYEEFQKVIKSKKLDTAIGKRVCKTAKTGCRGLCARDVLVDVTAPGKQALTYERVTADMVPSNCGRSPCEQCTREKVVGKG